MDEKFIDNYEHIDESVVYTETNVPGIGFDEEKFNSVPCMQCRCRSGGCDNHEECECLMYSGKNYNLGLLVDEKLTKTNSSVLECNSYCGCARMCNNRIVQFGPFKNLVIFKHGQKGYGLKTNSVIRRGEFICEYAGELISKEEAKKRSQNDETNYIFILREHIGNLSVNETFVDPTKIGNIGRYINHSCNPNSVVIPVRIDSIIPRLAIFALCNIQSDEEITYDYAGSQCNVSDNLVSSECNVQNNKTLCLCGSNNCRKYLPYDSELLN